MENSRRPAGRPPGAVFPRKFVLYEDDEGMALLDAVARRLGISKAAVLRLLLRERAEQLGLREQAALGPGK